jgi:hypothetical protein
MRIFCIKGGESGLHYTPPISATVETKKGNCQQKQNHKKEENLTKEKQKGGPENKRETKKG